MNLNTIKSKRTSDFQVELFEFIDDFNQTVGYSVIKSHVRLDVIGGGASRIEEYEFLNREDAITFFDNQC